MVYDPSQVFTWSKTSDADGDDFESEFNRIYANAQASVLGIAAIKTADYTILNTDPVGAIRAQNPNTSHSAQPYAAATNPVQITTAAHGLITGDIVATWASSDPTEVSAGYWPVTVISPSVFSLPFDNSGGGAGTISWVKVLTITLPAPAAGNLDKEILILMDGTAAWADAVRITDGVEDYYLDRPRQHLRMKSTGAAGRWFPVNPFHLGGRPGTRPAQLCHWYSGDGGPDLLPLMSAASATIDLDAYITEKTSAVLLDITISAATAGGSIDLASSSADNPKQQFGATYTGSGASGFIFNGTIWVGTSTQFGDGSQIYYNKNGLTIDKCRLMAYAGWSLLQ